MQRYGFYFFVLGVFGIITAVARAKNEREMFFILATIPTAFLVIRLAGFLSKRNKQ